jgi:hypothetical protein
MSQSDLHKLQAIFQSVFPWEAGSVLRTLDAIEDGALMLVDIDKAIAIHHGSLPQFHWKALTVGTVLYWRTMTLTFHPLANH